jgi:hypothetical protein
LLQIPSRIILSINTQGVHSEHFSAEELATTTSSKNDGHFVNHLLESVIECDFLFTKQILERIMNQAFELSMEQEFSIRSFEDQVQHLSQEEARDFLVKLYRQMVMKETMYKHFLAQEWGIGSQPHFS